MRQGLQWRFTTKIIVCVMIGLRLLHSNRDEIAGWSGWLWGHAFVPQIETSSSSPNNVFDELRLLTDLHPLVTAVPRIGLPPSPDLFFQYYSRVSSPFIMTLPPSSSPSSSSASSSSTPLPNITWESLRTTHGQTKVRVRGPTGAFVAMPLAEYIPKIMGAASEGKVLYAAGFKSQTLAQHLGLYLGEAATPDESFHPPFKYYARTSADGGVILGKANMWMGSAGSDTWLHKDSNDNFILQILGKKKFTVFPPRDADYLYLGAESDYVGSDKRKSLYRRSSIPGRRKGSGDNDEADGDGKDGCGIGRHGVDLSKFPLYTHTHPLCFDLQPGDILFLPAGWFHYVWNEEPSFSMNVWRYGKPEILTDTPSLFY